MTHAQLVARAHRGLAMEWIDFESALSKVPLIARLQAGRMRIEDYRSLLLNLRQQVIEGSRWIGRAASSLTPAYEDLRSLFVRHTAAEHRDYRMLEHDFEVAGGDPALMRSTPKNIGSEALSAYMYHSAGQPDPLGLLGAMFVIEGLGQRMAAGWAGSIKGQLNLGDEAVSFMLYHGENDDDHLAMFERAIELAVTSEEISDRIVRSAKIVARLYRLQLEEIDNV